MAASAELKATCSITGVVGVELFQISNTALHGQPTHEWLQYTFHHSFKFYLQNGNDVGTSIT